MTASVDDLHRVAKGQIGYTEKGGRDGKSGNLTKYGAAFGMDGVPWCSIFVWWCFKQVGIDLKKEITSAYASAQKAMDGWQSKGMKIVKSPKLMDVVFFEFDSDPTADHTGFVTGVDAKGVFTIEGNTSSGNHGSQSNGGGVYARYRPFSQIIGYGRYKWPAGCVQPPAPKAKPAQPTARSYPTLRRGSTGNDVKRLQHLLHIKVDGDFGPTTEKHVKQAQYNRHLVQDGIAGPATLRALGF